MQVNILINKKPARKRRNVLLSVTYPEEQKYSILGVAFSVSLGSTWDSLLYRVVLSIRHYLGCHRYLLSKCLR